MKLLSTESAGVRIVRLVGNFEPSDARGFEDAIEQAVEEGCPRIVVDTEHVNLVCSTGLGSFLRAHEVVKAHDGELACAALPPFAREIFGTIGLDRRLRCFDTVEDAVAALSAG